MNANSRNFHAAARIVSSSAGRYNSSIVPEYTPMLLQEGTSIAVEKTSRKQIAGRAHGVPAIKTEQVFLRG